MESPVALPLAHPAPLVRCDADPEHRSPRVQDSVEPTRVEALLKGHCGRECGAEVGCDGDRGAIRVESEPAGISDEAAVSGSRFKRGDIPRGAVEESGTDGVLLHGGNCEDVMPDARGVWRRGIDMLRAGCELLAFTTAGFDNAMGFRARA